MFKRIRQYFAERKKRKQFLKTYKKECAKFWEEHAEEIVEQALKGLDLNFGFNLPTREIEIYSNDLFVTGELANEQV